MKINLDILIQYSNDIYSGRNPQARALRLMLNEIFRVTDTNEVKVVYPKNLFVDDKQIEIYLFNDNKRHIMKLTYDKGELNSFLYFFKNIICLRNKVNSENDSRSIIIEFLTGEIIEFNSIRDTNSYHCNRFDELIIDISKLFLKYKND